MHFSTLVIPFLLPVAYAQLHTLAIAAGLKYFGTATDNNELTDTALVAALSNTTEFGQVTPGNSQKWDSIEPSPNTFAFKNGDVIAALAKKNTQILRCHTLVWFQQLPQWVQNGTWTKETLTAALTNHVTKEVTQYKGQCYAWDVVNEALESDGTFRKSVFFNILGEDYIRIAFEAAAAADPDAKLYYNDFSIENPSPKTTAALNIVKSLKASGTKIDGAGLQSHFIVGSTPSKEVQIANLKSFTALGVEVAITELDIRMTLPSTAALNTQQSIDYQNTVAACVEVEGCVGITVWDFDDKYSWVPSTFPGTGSACLFDENLVRKEAYFGVVAALTGATENGTNNTNGNQKSSTQISQSGNGTTLNVSGCSYPGSNSSGSTRGCNISRPNVAGSNGTGFITAGTSMRGSNSADSESPSSGSSSSGSSSYDSSSSDSPGLDSPGFNSPNSESGSASSISVWPSSNSPGSNASGSNSSSSNTPSSNTPSSGTTNSPASQQLPISGSSTIPSISPFVLLTVLSASMSTLYLI